MLGYEAIEAVPAAGNDDDENVVLDEALGCGAAYAGGGTSDEGCTVGKGHDDEEEDDDDDSIDVWRSEMYCALGTS